MESPRPDRVDKIRAMILASVIRENYLEEILENLRETSLGREREVAIHHQTSTPGRYLSEAFRGSHGG